MRNFKPFTVPSLAVLITLFVAPAILAQGRAYTPDKGSAERKAITDALRVPVGKRVNRDVVILKVDHLKVQDDWAFLLGMVRRPDGGPIDYPYTPYRDANKSGMFDDNVMALLHKVGGQWHLVRYMIGATAMTYLGWDRKFHAPQAIFPH
jgi:hypothetical protein